MNTRLVDFTASAMIDHESQMFVYVDRHYRLDMLILRNISMDGNEIHII